MITALIAAIVGTPWFPSALHVKPASKALKPEPMSTALASWYDDRGATASGVHYTYGFAALIFGSQWGRSVRFCYSGRCVTGRLDDHGPYVSGRTFDLNFSLRTALGCADLCWVRWR